MELKEIALKKRGLLKSEHVFEAIQRANRENDFELERTFKNELEELKDEDKAKIDVHYEVWELVKTGELSKNTGREKSGKTMKMVKHKSAEYLSEIILRV